MNCRRQRYSSENSISSKTGRLIFPEHFSPVFFFEMSKNPVNRPKFKEYLKLFQWFLQLSIEIFIGTLNPDF